MNYSSKGNDTDTTIFKMKTLLMTAARSRSAFSFRMVVMAQEQNCDIKTTSIYYWEGANLVEAIGDLLDVDGNAWV
jgi:hypothetical protein